MALFSFSIVVIFLGLVLSIFCIKETLPWAGLHHKESLKSASNNDKTHLENDYSIPQQTNLLTLFKFSSLKNKPLIALNQAGLVEKFTDAIVWIFLPIYFIKQGLSLIEAGAIIAIYGVTWGTAQLITGPLSDKIGRKKLIIFGMWGCGLGILLIPFTQGTLLWSIEAAYIGISMAMLYPNLGASIGDVSPSHHRASLIGIYRFWRDSGYAFGALFMGIMAQWSQNLLFPFWFVGISMCLSGFLVYRWLPQDFKMSN